MKYYIYYAFIFFAFVFTTNLGAQVLPVNTDALLRLQNKLSDQQKQTEKALKKIKRQKAFKSLIERMEVRGYQLDGIVHGHPQFIGHHNAETFTSLGGEAATSGGSLGLNLDGARINAIIWDSGISRQSHQEFTGRITRKDVGAEDFHATHVAGTLMAAGIDPDAKGFLPGASIKTYDFTTDDIEIINELMIGDVHLSNHSYGIVLGWSDGMWLGDENISDQEDYRFGYYNQNARTMDEILFNAPFYTMVKSAGNDRGDSGDGTFPPDGPYDSIGGFGVSKNILSIGAVEKLTAPYASPSDVVMSSFSGWGPTDDGRIKPDFVAPGVGIYSATNTSDTDYLILQGTSMASPAAAGAVGLINEANFTLTGNYLRGATIKAIMMATAHEAGDGDGPDYEFGWGLISIENALNHIVGNDGVNKHVIEATLSQGEEYMVELNPLADEKITIALAWRDPAGTPVGASLDPTDVMLINDLDVRLEDESGNIIMPWILDPTKPMNVATRGDNILDNAEKIEFSNPLPRKYFVKVTHKGTLENESQDFSLIIDNTSQDPGIENFYWVLNDGSLEGGTNWATTSGGGISGNSPNNNSKLIFDDNSDSNGTDIDILLNQNLIVNSLLVLTDKNIHIDLQGNDLIISNDILNNGSNLTLSNGRLILENTDASENKTVQFNQLNGSGLTIMLSPVNQAGWSFKNSIASMQALSAQGGSLTLDNSSLTIDETVFFNNQLNDLGNSTLIFEGNGSDAVLTSASLINSEVEARKTLNINSETSFNIMKLTAGLLKIVSGGISINELQSEDSNINLDPGLTLTIVDNWEVNNSSNYVQEIFNSNGKATIQIESHIKLCFENFNITNVDVTGEAAVGVGLNSSISNSENWIAKACDDILFANFTTDNSCAGAFSTLTNTSEGTYNSAEWFVDDVSISTDLNTNYTFPMEGIYAVKLEISDGASDVNSYTQMITVDTAQLDSNYVVANATQLVSFRSAPMYQWYQNEVAIDGATDRVLPYESLSGTYFVVTSDGICNRKSAVYDSNTTSIDSEESFRDAGLEIRPNPARDFVQIFNSGEQVSVKALSVNNAIGQTLKEFNALYIPTEGTVQLDVTGLPSGLYIVQLTTDIGLLTQKIVLR